MSHVTQLPLTRVKNVIKSDPDITLASQEAVILIAKVGFRLYVWCTTPCLINLTLQWRRPGNEGESLPIVDSLLYCQYLKACLNVLCQDPPLEAIGSGHETKEGD